MVCSCDRVSGGTLFPVRPWKGITATLRPGFRALPFLALGLGTLSGPASAQEEDLERLEIRVLFSGAFFASDAADEVPLEEGESANLSFDDDLGYGISFGVLLTERWVVEVGAQVVSTELTVTVPEGSVGFDTDVVLVGGDLAYRFGEIGDSWRPFVVAGGGVKGYDGSLFSNEVDPMWNFGGGVLLDTGWLVDVRLDARNYMSVFDSLGDDKLQNDVLLSVGAVFSVF